MKRIDNYEVLFTTLHEDEVEKSIVVLTFAWSDASDTPPSWPVEDTSLHARSDGLVLLVPNLGEILFPLSQYVHIPGGALNSEELMADIRARSGLYVCAFDEEGGILASQGFLVEDMVWTQT